MLALNLRGKNVIFVSAALKPARSNPGVQTRQEAVRSEVFSGGRRQGGKTRVRLIDIMFYLSVR